MNAVLAHHVLLQSIALERVQTTLARVHGFEDLIEPPTHVLKFPQPVFHNVSKVCV